MPFADGCFPTPSGKVELFCNRLAAHGIDPLPTYVSADDDGGVNGQSQWRKRDSLNLISGAAHHFTTSTFANQDALVAREGEPFVEIHPDDAADRRIRHGDTVVVENGRGSAELIARVTDAVCPGVVASPKAAGPGSMMGATSTGPRQMRWAIWPAKAHFIRIGCGYVKRVMNKSRNKTNWFVGVLAATIIVLLLGPGAIRTVAQEDEIVRIIDP